MDQAAITNYILGTFDSVEMQEAHDYVFFFYKSERMIPFATLATMDHEYDNVSQLDRPGVFRLNLGVNGETFRTLLLGAAVDGDTEVDYAALDRIMPHPDYARQHWVCVLNPGEETLETVKGLLAEAYEIAAKRHNRT